MIAGLHSRGLTFGLRIWRGVHKLAVERKAPVYGTNYTMDQVILGKIIRLSLCSTAQQLHTRFTIIFSSCFF